MCAHRYHLERIEFRKQEMKYQCGADRMHEGWAMELKVRRVVTETP
jgi:hypothetical protein